MDFVILPCQNFKNRKKYNIINNDIHEVIFDAHKITHIKNTKKKMLEKNELPKYNTFCFQE